MITGTGKRGNRGQVTTTFNYSDAKLSLTPIPDKC